MPGMPLPSIVSILIGGVALLAGCIPAQTEPSRAIQLYQTWQLQPGSTIASYPVTNGLGDVGIALQGKSIHAPFAGRVQPHNGSCVVFSSPEIPAYLFRLCGLHQPHLGAVQAGEAIGSGNAVQFAALRKQPNGTWAFVEPSRTLLEQMLRPPS